MTRRRGDRRKTKHTRDQQLIVLDDDHWPQKTQFSSPHGTFLVVFFKRTHAWKIINLSSGKQETWDMGNANTVHPRVCDHEGHPKIIRHIDDWVLMRVRDTAPSVDLPFVYSYRGYVFLRYADGEVVPLANMRYWFEVNYVDDSLIYVGVDRTTLFTCDTNQKKIEQRNISRWPDIVGVLGRAYKSFISTPISSRGTMFITKRVFGHRLAMLEIVNSQNCLLHRFSISFPRGAIYKGLEFSPDSSLVAVLFSKCVVLYDLFEAMIARVLRSFAFAFFGILPPYVVLHVFELWFGDTVEEFSHGKKILVVLKLFDKIRQLREERK